MARKFSTRKTFSEISMMSMPELRKEYTVLRDIFQKRVRRMYNAGIQEAKDYMRGGEMYVPKLSERPLLRPFLQLPGVDQRAALVYEVQLLNKLVGSRERGLPAAGTFSITGKKREAVNVNDKILKTLHESGYEHITKSTLKKFGRFMDAMRQQYGRKLPNSAEMAEFFETLKYNTKRKSTSFLVDLWKDFEKNGYEPDYGNRDLFRA